MTPERLKYLTQRYRANECTPKELDEFLQWYEGLDDPEIPEVYQEGTAEAEAYVNEHYRRFGKRVRAGQRSKVVRFWLRVAAALILLAAGVLWFIMHQRPVLQPPAIALQNDAKPGGDHATLTLANGQTISLDSTGNGNIASIDGMQVIKVDSGQLALKGSAGTQTQAYNTLATPRGGRFAIQLPDGTKVWLNAATTLKFPVAFSGNERRVQLDGEAYFEVAHDAQKPFYVTARGQQIKVLGTHFNVNSYADENGIRTTLLQGSVQVSAAGKEALLKPGQEAILQSGNITTQKANMERATAWKDGLLDMDGQSLEEIMRQVSRWYNVDVEYVGGSAPNIKLSGQMDRGLMLSEIINSLQQMHVRCRMEGGKLIIKP